MNNLSNAQVFCLGLLLGGTSIIASNYLLNKKKNNDKIEQIGNDSQNNKNNVAILRTEEEQLEEEEEILKEQFTRTISFVGEENFHKIRDAFVVVVGLGGVGSHAAHMLARSGITKLRLIDFDQVTLSSLNRHAVAKRKDVGRSKVSVVKRHLEKILPKIQIDIHNVMFSKKNAKELLKGHPSFVLDCIDDVNTKTDLLEYCVQNKLPVISSMAAGGRCDPSCLVVSDISSTVESVDPLARATRKKLKRSNISEGIYVIYSTERSKPLLPLSDVQQDAPDQFSPLPHMRTRVVPVLGTMPALFGNAMSSFVLTYLAGQPIKLIARDRPFFISKILSSLVNDEKIIYKMKTSKDDFNISDIEYLIEEVWCGRSALSGETEKLVLTRWRKEEEPSLGNLILLTQNEAKTHQNVERSNDLNSIYSNEFINLVEKNLNEAKSFKVNLAREAISI